MKKENYQKLCESCKAILRQEDTENKRVYRLKLKEKQKQVSGKIKVVHKSA